MRRNLTLLLILIDALLWGILVYYFFSFPLNCNVYVKSRKGIAEFTFYKYSFYDSAKFIFKNELYYINPPDYDSFKGYYDSRPVLKNTKKTIILTKISRTHIESVKKLLSREKIKNIYFPFANFNMGKNKDLISKIKEENIFFRYYFDVDETIGDKLKIRFVYPDYGVKSNSGGFILYYKKHKIAFFSDMNSKGRKRISKLLKENKFDIVKLPSNGNFCSYGIKSKYLVVFDDLSNKYGVMKFKYYQFYTKMKKKVFRTLLNGNIRVFDYGTKYLFYTEML